MPFRSRSQERKFFAMEERGELPAGTAERWAHHTKSIKKLPEHVKKHKKKAELEHPQPFNMQQFMPAQARRAMTPQEHSDVDRGKSQWLPSIFQNYGTPLHMMLASPWKQGILAGLAGAGIGGLAGANIGSNLSGSSPAMAGLGALAGAVGVGGTAGLVTGLGRNAKNEGIIEMMKRLPENSVKRDLLSDPAYQADQRRESESDNMNKLLMMMQSDRMMNPSSMMTGKFSSARELGEKAAGIMDNVDRGLAAVLDSTRQAISNVPTEAWVAGGTLGATSGLIAALGAIAQRKKNQQKAASLTLVKLSHFADLPLSTMGLGAAAGMTGGAALAPSGHKMEGVGRGLTRGLSTGAGAALGGLAGAGLGSTLGTDVDSKMQAAHMVAILGAVLGGSGGYAFGGGLVGSPSWEKEKYQA